MFILNNLAVFREAGYCVNPSWLTKKDCHRFICYVEITKTGRRAKESFLETQRKAARPDIPVDGDASWRHHRGYTLAANARMCLNDASIVCNALFGCERTPGNERDVRSGTQWLGFGPAVLRVTLWRLTSSTSTCILTHDDFDFTWHIVWLNLAATKR